MSQKTTIDDRIEEVLHRQDCVTNHIEIIIDLMHDNNQHAVSYPDETQALWQLKQDFVAVKTAMMLRNIYGLDCEEVEEYPTETIDRLLDD